MEVVHSVFMAVELPKSLALAYTKLVFDYKVFKYPKAVEMMKDFAKQWGFVEKKAFEGVREFTGLKPRDAIEMRFIPTDRRTKDLPIIIPRNYAKEIIIPFRPTAESIRRINEHVIDSLTYCVLRQHLDGELQDDIGIWLIEMHSFVIGAQLAGIMRSRGKGRETRRKSPQETRALLSDNETRRLLSEFLHERKVQLPHGLVQDDVFKIIANEYSRVRNYDGKQWLLRIHGRVTRRSRRVR